MTFESNAFQSERLKQFCRQVAETPETPDLISLVASETAYIHFCRDIIKPEKANLQRFEVFCRSNNLNAALIRQRLELAANALGVDHKIDYFEILGVPPDADDQTIKKAYREKARLYHPDRNNGNIECSNRFVELHAAYMHLSDPEMRRQYAQSQPEAWSEGENPDDLKVPGNSFGLFFSWMCVCIGILVVIAFGVDLYQSHSARQASQPPPMTDQKDDPTSLVASNDGAAVPADDTFVEPTENPFASDESGDPEDRSDGQSPVLSDTDYGDDELLFYDPDREKPYWIGGDAQYQDLDAAIASLAGQYGRDPAWVKTFRGGENDWQAIHQNLMDQLSLEDDSEGSMMAAVDQSVNEASRPAEVPESVNRADDELDDIDRDEVAADEPVTPAVLEAVKLIPMPNQPKAVEASLPIAQASDQKDTKADTQSRPSVEKEPAPPGKKTEPVRLAKANKSKAVVTQKKTVKVSAKPKAPAVTAKPKAPTAATKKKTAAVDTKPKTQVVAAKAAVKEGLGDKSLDLEHDIDKIRIVSFLDEYTDTYESKNLDQFKAFFTQDAMEQGKAFKTLLPTYQKTFNSIEELKYDIDMTSFSKEKGSNKIIVEGNFTAQYRLPDNEKWGTSTGSVWMELLETPKALRVKQLNYEMKQ